MLQQSSQQAFNDFLIKNAVLTKTKEGSLKPANQVSNCVLILENDPNLKERLKLNELSHALEIVKPFPWNTQSNFKTKLWDDTDEAYLRRYFEKYSMLNTKAILNDAIKIVSNKNKYHPIKEYFSTLQWDKVPRIDTLLHKLFITESNIYYSEVLKVFMVGAVSRIYTPGYKFDYMPIITGEQGIGKSTFFKLLSVRPEWYLEDLRSIDKSGIEQIQGKWIIEWAELNAMYKAKEVAAIKTFITTTNDTVRLAYDKYASNFSRQCVFCGTTNEDNFLHDKTGNRRFLPIKSNIPRGSMIDVNYLASIVNQLWAESLELYNSGYVPVLSKEAENIASNMQTEVMDEDIYYGIIQEFLESWTWGDKAVKEVCTKMLWDKAIKSNREMKRGDSVNIARIMNNMDGWKKYSNSIDGRKKIVGYGYQVCWVKE